MPVTVTSKTWKAELKKLGVDRDGGLADALDVYANLVGKDLKKELQALEQTSTTALAAGRLLKAQKELAKIADTVVIQAKAELRRLSEELKSSDEGKGRDKKLFAGLKRARTQPMFFAVVVRNAREGKLLISKSRIRPSDVSAAKKSLGGGRALLGQCRYQSGSYHFVLKKEPPMTLARMIKRIAKEQAGLLIKPVCSGAGEENESKEK